MTERRIFLHDVGIAHALGVQEGAQNFVGRARIHIIRTQKNPAFGFAAVLAHQIFHRRDCLLVWRGARIEHIARGFLAFILHRIEQ